jgi:hypothetical protein
MWRRVDLVDWTDVSEERIASISRVEKSASEEPAWAGGCRLSHQSKTPSYIRTGGGPRGTRETTPTPRARVCVDASVQPTDLHGAASQKTAFFIVTAVKTW